MGNAGFVILYVLSLAASGMVGMLFAVYAGRCVLVIVNQTSGGNNEVEWPDEPYYDYFGHSLHLGWMLAFSFVPAWVLCKIVAQAQLFEQDWSWLIFVSVVWLTFPVYLLSNLSGHGRWTVLHPKFLQQAFRHAGVMLLFYGLSAILLGGALWLAYFTLFQASFLFVLLSPVVLMIALFIYARLLGRTAMLVSVETHKKRKKQSRPKVRGVSSDPWAVPEEEETDDDEEENSDVSEEVESSTIDEEVKDDWATEAIPYALAKEDARTDLPERKHSTFDEDPGTYEVSEEEPAARSGPATEGDSYYDGPVSEENLERELELRKRKSKKKKHKPKVVPSLFLGVFEFPFYLQTLVPLVMLSFVGTVLSVLIRCVQLLQPG